MEFLRLTLLWSILLISMVGCNNDATPANGNFAAENQDTSLRKRVIFAPVGVIRGAINHNTTDYYVLNGAIQGFHHDILRKTQSLI